MAEAEDQMKLVMNSHTVCRGPDGKIKWEADTEQIELPLGTHTVMGIQPAFQISTAQIKTGREHF